MAGHDFDFWNAEFKELIKNNIFMFKLGVQEKGKAREGALGFTWKDMEVAMNEITHGRDNWGNKKRSRVEVW